MPQTALSRTPDTGAGRRARGVCSMSSDASSARTASRRAARLAAPLLALCCGLAGSAGALAQTAGNQIYIAGPGGQNGTEAAQMSSMLNAPGHGPNIPGTAPLTPVSIPAPAARGDDTPPGMITIPGPGERSAAAWQASAPNIVTIPAPGTPPANPAATAPNSAPALQRVNVGTAASRVAPVVVGASAAAGNETHVALLGEGVAGLAKEIGAYGATKVHVAENAALKLYNAETYTAVVAELAKSLSPDVILASWCGKKVVPDRIRKRPGWSEIPAVCNDRIIEIKSPLILQPGPAALTDGLDAIVAALWPAATPSPPRTIPR